MKWMKYMTEWAHTIAIQEYECPKCKAKKGIKQLRKILSKIKNLYQNEHFLIIN